jgi:hypothetical protein
MYVIARYGKEEIPLGDMPFLPTCEDRLLLPVGDEQVMLTVGRRIFERRSGQLRITSFDSDTGDIPIAGSPRWVCILVFLEATP